MALEGEIRGVEDRAGDLMADAALMVDDDVWLTVLVAD